MRSCKAQCSTLKRDMLGLTVNFILLIVAVDAVLYSYNVNNQSKSRFTVSKSSTFQDGDIVLGGLFPVHTTAKDGTVCGMLRSRDLVQFTQAMIFAIDEVNNDSNLLPNVSLGFEIFDYCSKDVLALEKASIFLNTCPGLTLQTHGSPVVGVVGPYSSSITLQVSNLLGLFKIPHISYGATSPLLSDKDRFKFFLRTVPSDKIRALAIAETLYMSGTNYVSLLYSEGDFGRGGAQYFTQEAKAKGICIAVTKELHTSQEVIEAVQELARKKRAKVVVLFCTKSHIKEVFWAAKNLGLEDSFFWLVGGDSSETHLYLNENEEMAGKVIIFAPRSDVSFESWKDKMNDNRNPWIDEMKQQNVEKKNGDLSDSGGEVFITASHVQNVVIAVNSFAHALDRLVRTLCANTSTTDLIPCVQKKAADGKQLLDFINSSSFEIRGRNIQFDQNGDICAEYELLRPSKSNNTDAWSFTKVGEWKHVKIRDVLDSPATKPRVIFPKTTCASPCGIDEVTILQLDSCCWSCVACKKNEIHVKKNTECEACPAGSKVNADRTICLSLPTFRTDPESAFIVLTICLAATGLLCSFVILAVFVFRKDDPIIKASSRGLSCVLLAGVILSCSGSFLEILEPSPLVCILKRYSCLGFIMCYTGMFSKSLRFNRLFNSSLRFSMNPTLVSTRSQLILMGSIWGIAALFYTGWGFYSFEESVATIYTEEAIVIQCRVTDLECVLGVSFDLILLSLCAFYTFKTRKLPKQFRETKGLGVSIYSTATVQLIALATVCSLQPENLFRGRMFLISKPILALLILVPIFLPKMYGVFCYRGKKARPGDLKLRAEDRFENIHGGVEMNALEAVRNPTDFQLDARSCHLIQCGNESLQRRSVLSADFGSHTTSTDTLRSSEEVIPSLPGDSARAVHRPGSDTGRLLQKATPTSIASVYSIWL